VAINLRAKLQRFTGRERSIGPGVKNRAAITKTGNAYAV